MLGNAVENKCFKSPGQLSGKKVLVTGANGFIGSHLCYRLSRSGAQVNAVSRSRHFNVEYGLHWWRADLAEIKMVRELLAAIKPDIIFHLAGYPVGARELHHVAPSFRCNLMSTVNLMMVATEVGCSRLILTGSLEAPDEVNPETFPSSPYAAAKWAASGYAQMFHALYRLPVVTLRVFMVYGPQQRDLGKLIPYVILSLLRGDAPKLTNGRREVDWIYVEDVVEAFLAAAQAVDIEGTTIDVGSGKMVTVRAVVKHLVDSINPQIEPDFGALADRPFEQVRVADIARTCAMIGWRPAVSLEEGLGLTVDWFRKRSLCLSSSSD